MRSLDKAIRQKRFRVKDDVQLELVIETAMGSRLNFKVIDASINGIGAELSGADVAEGELASDQLVPESKLQWGTQNSTLGRLVVRRKWRPKDEKGNEGNLLVAFTLLDSRVPLTGPMSRCFDVLEHGEESPFDFEIGSQKFNLAHFTEAEFNHPDLFEKCREYQFFLSDLKKNPLFQYYSTKQSLNNARSSYKLSNQRVAKEYISFSSYDYLGMSQNKEVQEAAREAIGKFGLSSSGSLLLSGRCSLHEDLEEKLAKILNKEDTLLFSSGFGTNIGSITALIRPNDLVVADIYSHASLHDGISASKARARFFKHNSMTHLDAILDEHRRDHSGTLILTEGLFSMEGSVPDLQRFVTIAKKHNARTFIDECHSFGVLGPSGLGAAERFGLLHEIDLYMASFSKAFGSGVGGFVSGPKAVIDWLRYFARAGVFSAAPPPVITAAATKSLEIILREPERRVRLLENIKRFRTGLKRLGFTTTADEESPIVPIVIGSEETLSKMNAVMVERNIFVSAILFPAVPLNGARFRFSITSLHNESDIDLALVALEEACRRAGFSPPEAMES